jgi:hypothetical protein
MEQASRQRYQDRRRPPPPRCRTRLGPHQQQPQPARQGQDQYLRRRSHLWFSQLAIEDLLVPCEPRHSHIQGRIVEKHNQRGFHEASLAFKSIHDRAKIITGLFLFICFDSFSFEVLLE